MTRAYGGIRTGVWGNSVRVAGIRGMHGAFLLAFRASATCDTRVGD